MLTLFSIPKPFVGHIGMIQRNALASWRRLGPAVEIMLLGSDAGVAEAAHEFGCHHEPQLAVNDHGTPLVSDAFMRVRRQSTRPLLLYSNTDILFDRTLLAAATAVESLPAFLLSGRRWDLPVTVDLRGASDREWDELFASRAARGRLHGPAGMDYMLFPRSHDFGMPAFAVGRVGWDSWLVWKSRMNGVPVVDATVEVNVIHQDHDYASLKLGYQHARGPERDANLLAAGGLSHLLTLREASHRLAGGRLVAPPWPARAFALLGTTLPYQKLLALKRALS
jgi:hypothetical protein